MILSSNVHVVPLSTVCTYGTTNVRGTITMCVVSYIVLITVHVFPRLVQSHESLSFFGCVLSASSS
ncbi:unnamed protein product, partial [Prunus brigantina]